MASKFATRCQTPYPDSRELCQQQSWLDVGSRCAEVWSKKNDAIIPARHHGRFLAAAARHRPALGQGGEWPEQIFAQQKICLIFFCFISKLNWTRYTVNMSAIGSLIFCTDCGNLLQESTGDAGAILLCDICGARNKGWLVGCIALHCIDTSI